MATYREAFELARRLLGDKSGVIYKEGGLMPMIVESLRKCQRELAENGMAILRGLQTVTIPVGTTALGALTVPALAPDLVVPWELEEMDGGTTGHFRPMEPDRNMLPDINLTTRLRVWNWRGGQLTFLGATRDVSIRINYERELPIPQLMTDTIPIVGGASPIAYFTAYQIDGKPEHMALYDDALHSVISSQLRADQYRPVRRIPYRYR